MSKYNNVWLIYFFLSLLSQTIHALIHSFITSHIHLVHTWTSFILTSVCPSSYIHIFSPSLTHSCCCPTFHSLLHVNILYQLPLSNLFLNPHTFPVPSLICIALPPLPVAIYLGIRKRPSPGPPDAAGMWRCGAPATRPRWCSHCVRRRRAVAARSTWQGLSLLSCTHGAAGARVAFEAEVCQLPSGLGQSSGVRFKRLWGAPLAFRDIATKVSKELELWGRQEAGQNWWPTGQVDGGGGGGGDGREHRLLFLPGFHLMWCGQRCLASTKDPLPLMPPITARQTDAQTWIDRHRQTYDLTLEMSVTYDPCLKCHHLHLMWAHGFKLFLFFFHDFMFDDKNGVEWWDWGFVVVNVVFSCCTTFVIIPF